MNIYTFAGILGTVFSISTFFIPEKWKSKKITLAVFVFVIVILCIIITNQNSKLSRVKKVSSAANNLSNSRSTEFTDEGYIQAALAFLEQNKDMYPESYDRANIIYQKFKNDKNTYSTNVVMLSSEMDGLIKGIGILNSE